MKWWAWLLAGFIVAVGGALWLWLRLRGRKREATRVGVEAMTEWHRVSVQRKKVRVEHLLKDFQANQHKIARISDELDRKKQRLEQDYEEKGLTDEEIVARFRRIGL